MEEKENPKISYESLWKYIIRPERTIYKKRDLGNPSFSLKGKNYVRKDYNLISSEGYLMKCSFFEPEPFYRPKRVMPVVLYLHGNSSSRLEGISNLKEILKLDINFFVVDFPGCGLSEGEYISLGYHESRDVRIIINFLEKIPGVGVIGLWGRSMGAATTILYAHKDERVKAIVMDSPFADFNILAKELVLKKIKLKPIESAPKAKQPALFIHADNDELIDKKHSEMLINAYGGNIKKLKKCEGTHNSKRSYKIIKDIAEFFYGYLVTEIQNNYNK